MYNAFGTADVIVDVEGWFAAGSGFTALEPSRVVDTRAGVAVGAGGTLDVSVVGVGGVPLSGEDAVVLNVTVTGPSQAGWATVFPAGVVRPLASNLNFAAGETVANLVIAKVGAGGKVSVYNAFGTADVIVDVMGWFGSGKPVFYGLDSSWRFVPGNVVLAPGESKIVKLEQDDGLGADTGSALPPGVTFPASGAAGSVLVEPLGGSSVRVTAGATIDTVVVGARIPGWEIGPSLGVTIARIRPETVQLTDDQILFPQTDLPAGVDPSTVLPPGVDADGPGPFTWQQYRDRLNLPTDGMASITDVVAAEGAEYWYPVVLVGPPPAAGSVVLGIEGNALLGRVIEPAGAPSLTADGFSMVTIQIVGAPAAYLDLHYDLDYQDLTALGVVPAPYVYDSGPAVAVQTAHAAQAALSGPSRSTHQPAEDTPAPPATPTTPPTEPPDTGQVSGSSSNTQQAPARSFGDWANQCKNSILANPSFSASLVQVEPGLSISLTPIIDFFLNVRNGATTDVSMKAGLSASATLQMKVKVQLAINAEASCPPLPFAELEVAFPGVLAPIMNFVMRGEITMKIGLKIEGGPRLTYGYGCTYGMELSGGFHWSSISGFEALKNDVFNKSCTESKEGSYAVVDTGVTSDGVGLLFEPSIGIPVSSPVGVRIGGSVAEAIGNVLSWLAPGAPELGLVIALKAEVGPSVKFTWENVSNALANKDAKGGVAAEFGAKAFLELESIYFLAAKFVAKPSGSTATLEIPIIELKLPLGTLYAPLKKTRFEVKVNDETTSETPAVYVQKDDQLVLQSVMTPATAGVTLGTTPQLTEGWLYRRRGNSWERSTMFGAVVPLVSPGAERALGTTTLRIQHQITQEVCDDLRNAPVEFALVGNAPMHLSSFDLPVPAWGGTFSIQCVDGMVKWDPTSIPDLKPDEVRRPVSLKTSGAQADRLTFSGVPSWLEFAYDPIDVGQQLDGEQEIPLFIRIKDDGSEANCTRRTATIRVDSRHRGSKNLEVTEDEKCYVRFEPVNVTGPAVVNADLHTKGFRATYLNVALIRAQLPSWLHLVAPVPTTPPGNPVEIALPATPGDETVVPFELTVDAREPNCTDQPARVHIIEVNDADRGHTVLTVRDPRVDKRTDCGFKFTPNHLPGSGVSTLSLRDDRLTGQDVAGWEFDEIPYWLTVSPTEGAFRNGGSTTVLFGGSPPYNPCIGRPEMHVTLYATATLPDNATMDAMMVLDYGRIPPVRCTDPTGRSDGDPHMVSYDGVRWEGQTLGEYVYLQTQPGALHSMRLVARHQPTNPAFVDDSRAPASVTAVALEVDDHLVEMYLDGSTYVDHQQVSLADGVPVAVSAQLAVVRTGDDVRFDAPGLTVTLHPRGDMMDVSVSPAFGSDVRGVLGTPDGDRSNDFIGADGTVYDPAAIVELHLPEFSDFNRSWRLTDQATSPFTRQLSASRFGKASPGFDQALFDQWGSQADALIATVATVCDNGTGVDLRKRYAIALELSLGTPLATIEEYLCHYGVKGVAAVDGQPVPGLTVTVDGAGFKPCVTTTGPDGSYLCMVAPDSTEAGGVAPTLPLPLQVVGTWEGRPGVAAQTTAAFATLAPTDGSPLITSADLVLDAGSVPVLVASGTASRDGVALGGDHQFTVEAFNGAGTRVGLFSVTAAVDPDTGAYSFRRALPGTSVRARVVSDVETPVFERFQAEFPGLGLGANAVTFDLAYVVPQLTVSGTASTGTAGLAGPITIEVRATAQGGGLLPAQRASATPDPVTGSYTVTVPLPRTATGGRAVMIVPPLAEEYPSQVVSIAPGANALTLDVVHNPPVVDVHGTMLDEHGNPLVGSYTLTTSFYDANGVRVGFTQVGIVTDANGVYSLPRVGRVGAVSMEASVQAGVAFEEFTSGRVAVTPGANSLQLDVTLAPVRLAVSGTFVDAAGVPLAGPISVSAQFFGAGGVSLGAQTVGVTPAAGGAYTAEFTGSRLATSARLLANIGVGPEQYLLPVPVVTAGANQVTFDVVHNPPVLTVSGTLVDSATGNPLAGPISIGVEFSQPDGSFVGFNDGYATVTPSSLDGSYTFTMVGPHTATAARLTAYLGQNGETARADVPVLVPGANSFTFNAGFAAPVVTLTGTMLRTGGAALAASAWVDLRAVDGGGTQVHTSRVLVAIAANGAYSLTRTLPQGAVGFEATVETSEFVPDWQSSGVRAVVNGAQTLTFDVLHQPVQLQLSGTMTKAPGQALAGPVQIGVSAIDSAGTQLAYLQRAVMPQAGTGAYALTLTLPVHTDHVDLVGYVGTHPFEQERLTVSGFTPGNLTNATFDVVHAPVTLQVSGTARVNGVLSNGFVAVRARATVPGQAGQVVVQVYPQAVDGAYSASLVLPDGATAATVEVQSLDGANTYSSVQGNLLPNETRAVTIDFDDAPSTLTLSGTMRMYGDPAAYASLTVTTFDAGGTQLSQRQIQLGLQAGGSYSIEVPVADGTARASVVATAGVGLYETVTDTFELAGLVPGANTGTVSLDATLLQLDGTLLDGGVPVTVSEPQLVFTTTGTRGGRPFSYTSSADYETPYTLGTGQFFYSLIVPGDVTDATVSIVGVADPAPVHHFSGLVPGRYLETWATDIAGTTTRPFTVNGTMLFDRAPWAVGTMDVLITPYALDAANANTAVPWTNLGTVTAAVEVDATAGTWSWTGTLPPGTTVVSVEERPFGNQYGYQQAYVLPAGSTPVVEQFSNDFGTTALMFADRLLGGATCVAPTLMVEYRLWAFAVEPADKTGDASTWVGARAIDVVTAVPSLADDISRQSIHVPADTTYVYVAVSPSSVYTAGPWISSLSYGMTITPDSRLGFGNNFEFTCA